MRRRAFFAFVLAMGGLVGGAWGGGPPEGTTVVPAAVYTQRDGTIETLRKELAEANPKRFKASVYRGSDGEEMAYRLFAPETLAAGTKAPLMVVLHGGTPRGNDNLAHITGKNPAVGAGIWTTAAVQDKHPCFVFAPQCPAEPAAWTKDLVLKEGKWPHPAEPAPAMAMMLAILDKIVAEQPVDRGRIFIAGSSMGGFGVWDAVARRPGLFAAAIPVCGGPAEGVLPRMARVPLWIFHGGADEVVPVEFSRRAFAALRKMGAPVRYTEYEGSSHHMSPYAWTEPGLTEWLFAQQAAALQ